MTIYQIDKNKDINNQIFQDYESEGFDISVYKKIWEDDATYNNLEEIFQVFNLSHPDKYPGRSLSVSDLIEWNNKIYYCNSIGWINLENLSKEELEIKTR